MTCIVLAGSLVAVAMLTGLAAMLKLGGDERITNEAMAMALAADAHSGFEPVAAAVDRAGIAAIVHGADDRYMLIRRHGAKFASRPLKRPVRARLDRRFLTLAPADPVFGAITLDLGDDAPIWARRLERAIRG